MQNLLIMSHFVKREKDVEISVLACKTTGKHDSLKFSSYERTVSMPSIDFR